MKTCVICIGMIVAILAGLTVVPGIDILAWHLLQPDGFYQKAILVIIELVTLWPRFVLGFLAWALVIGFTSALTEV